MLLRLDGLAHAHIAVEAALLAEGQERVPQDAHMHKKPSSACLSFATLQPEAHACIDTQQAQSELHATVTASAQHLPLPMAPPSSAAMFQELFMQQSALLKQIEKAFAATPKLSAMDRFDTDGRSCMGVHASVCNVLGAVEIAVNGSDHNAITSCMVWLGRMSAWSPLRSIKALARYFMISIALGGGAWYIHPLLVDWTGQFLHLDYKVGMLALRTASVSGWLLRCDVFA